MTLKNKTGRVLRRVLPTDIQKAADMNFLTRLYFQQQQHRRNKGN